MGLVGCNPSLGGLSLSEQALQNREARQQVFTDLLGNAVRERCSRQRLTLNLHTRVGYDGLPRCIRHWAAGTSAGVEITAAVEPDAPSARLLLATV